MTSFTVKIVVLACIMLFSQGSGPSLARGDHCIEKLVDEAARDRRVSHQQAVEEWAEDEVERQIDVGRCDDQFLRDTPLEQQACCIAIACDEFVAKRLGEFG